MLLLVGLISAALMQDIQVAPPSSGWTWTLYANGGPVVLANEVPDTPFLRTTFECLPGAGQVRMTQYQPAPPPPGPASLTSGHVRTEVEVEAQRQGLIASLKTSDPVFLAFSSSGRIRLDLQTASIPIQVDRANMATLRRFAELCGR